MGVHDAPQWLLSAWSRTCEGAGATASAEEIRAVGSRLIERWSEPNRHFHNLKHLVHVLSRVDELAEETHEPDVVRLAAWYHGAIFDAAEKAAYANRGGEDEVASAELARTELLALGVRERSADRVHHLVTALARHTAPPGDFDCSVLCDADLAVLAAEPQRYKAYLKDVRAEYAHVPVEDYLRARSTILTKLQNRPALFTSPLGAAWEEPARQNVAAELHRIDKELRALDAAHRAAEAGRTTSAAEAGRTTSAAEAGQAPSAAGAGQAPSAGDGARTAEDGVSGDPSRTVDGDAAARPVDASAASPASGRERATDRSGGAAPAPGAGDPADRRGRGTRRLPTFGRR